MFGEIAPADGHEDHRGRRAALQEEVYQRLGVDHGCDDTLRAQAKERKMAAGMAELAEGHAPTCWTPPRFWKLHGERLEGHYRQVIISINRRNVMFCVQVRDFT